MIKRRIKGVDLKTRMLFLNKPIVNHASHQGFRPDTLSIFDFNKILRIIPCNMIF